MMNCSRMNLRGIALQTLINNRKDICLNTDNVAGIKI
jgi:hypothetical protein